MKASVLSDSVFHEGYFVLTGVTGFLGSEVFCRLVRSVGFDRVLCLVRSVPKKDSIFFKRLQEHELSSDFDRIVFVLCDYSTQETFAQCLSDLTLRLGSKLAVVVHMAAIIHAKGADQKREQHRLNVEVTDELIDWSSKNGSHFVYISSVVAFGATLLKSKERDEDDFFRFPWISKFFSYYTSKRLSHNRVIERSRLPVVLICPGIVHGSLELEKSSRKHLVMLRQGRLRLAPSGSGNFVGLDRVSQSVVQSAMLVPKEKVQVRLLVDENMSFANYFNMYVRMSRPNSPQVVYKIPSFFGWFFVGVYFFLSLVGVHISFLETLSQGSLQLRFRSKFAQPPTEGLYKNLQKSLS